MKGNIQEAWTVTQAECCHLKLTTPVPRCSKHDWQQLLSEHAALNIWSHWARGAGGGEKSATRGKVVRNACTSFTEINRYIWVLWRGFYSRWRWKTVFAMYVSAIEHVSISHRGGTRRRLIVSPLLYAVVGTITLLIALKKNSNRRKNNLLPPIKGSAEGRGWNKGQSTCVTVSFRSVGSNVATKQLWSFPWRTGEPTCWFVCKFWVSGGVDWCGRRMITARIGKRVKVA